MALDVSAWSQLELEAPVAGGHRNEVWSGWWRDERVAVRRSRRSAESLAWELALIADLERAAFVVPSVVPTDAGLASAGGVVVQRWIEGHPPATADEWALVASELGRLHSVFAGRQQRPGCHVLHELDLAGRSVDADLAEIPVEVATELLDIFATASDARVSVVHGDPAPSNLRITAAGQVGLLDWDESRVDVTLLDLAHLGVRVLDEAQHAGALALADAWEVANAWVAEPDYARARWQELRSRQR